MSMLFLLLGLLSAIAVLGGGIALLVTMLGNRRRKNGEVDPRDDW